MTDEQVGSSAGDMRALLCRDWCQFPDLELTTVPRPPMEAGAVRIRVRAVGISYATGLTVSGRYQRKPPRPFVPGTEVAGEIIEIADDVTGFELGDRVMSFIDWGGFTEECVTWAGQVYKMADTMEWAEAIPLLSSYGTSYGALHMRANMQAGETVLIHGAAGGVGLAAVEIAKDHGCTVIARASTEEKRAHLRARGADHVLDSGNADFKQEILDLTDGLGCSLVYDPVGGDVFRTSLRCLDRGGRILTIGFAGGQDIPEIGMNLLLLKNISVLGFNWGTYWGWSPPDERVRFQPVRQQVMDGLNDLYTRGAIQPQVHGTWPLEEYGTAWSEIIERRALGRVALRP